MKKIKLFAPVLAIFTNLYWGLTTAYAEVLNTTGLDWVGKVKDGGQGGPQNLEEWLPQLLNLAIGLAALVCVAVLIGSGYMYITASGDETKVEKATKSLTYAIIGLVICFISAILVEFVLKQVLGVGQPGIQS